MARPPHDLDDRLDRRAPEWVKAVSAVLALATWAVFLFALLMSSGRSYGTPAIEGLGWTRGPEPQVIVSDLQCSCFRPMVPTNSQPFRIRDFREPVIPAVRDSAVTSGHKS
ncbi:MAG TPA: hypothetical protein VG897_14170 [Terriglobales bacterium]|nr:hypothetical protein [Terriglobales bacterium]